MALRQKVKESDVTVEMDSPDSTLADTLNKIRGQYESVAVKNRDETDTWYNKKVFFITRISSEYLQRTPDINENVSWHCWKIAFTEHF